MNPSAQPSSRRQTRQAQHGQSVKSLQAEIATLKKSQDSMQQVQEIKYLKNKISSLEKDAVRKSNAVINLSDALRKLNVPGVLINKLLANEPITATDVAEANTSSDFLKLVTPQ
jgi:hypothetical protein